MRKAPLAVALHEVRKRYRLYRSRLDLLLEISGTGRLLGRRARYTEHAALDGVSLDIPQGSRVGIIGRNGAGKTTLLKLVTRNYQPTSGSISVSGRVQALLATGLGFHPELTGAQNIRTSLIYNGLGRHEMEPAFRDIVEFAELDQYLDQPLKTYSLGMQSRLSFATATAVKPDILIIDEVLGAGDAYFTAKSSERMMELTSGGLTLLLVSHSMAQIVQFCDRVVWLEKGRIAMEGEAMEVVKAYERFIREMDEARLQRKNAGARAAASAAAPAAAGGRSHSAWPGLGDLRIASFEITDGAGASRATFDSGEALEYEVTIAPFEGPPRPCIVAINTYLLDGKQVLLDWSPSFAVPSAGATVSLRYDPLVLGNGEYVVSVGLYRTLDMNDTSTAQYYDLWDRSFQFKVATPFAQDLSVCKPPSRWSLPQ
jgi:lipopolysaccharide transport system ATP-binding protein